MAAPGKRRRLGGGEHENAERWLLTYSDMITLLVAFFIMMYSMSVLNLAKFHQVAISIKSGFGGTVSGAGHSILNQSGGEGIRPIIVPDMGLGQPEILGRRIRSYVKKRHLEKEIRVIVTERGVRVTMVTDGKILFPKGEAYITPTTAQVLDKLASLIRQTHNLVRVEGHTDDLPINTPRYPSNWELSTCRATTVVRYLIENCRIDPTRVSAAGYADSRPLVPNNSEAHRRFNRRVDIVILQNDEGTPRQLAKQ